MHNIFIKSLRAFCGRSLDFLTIIDHATAKRVSTSQLNLIENSPLASEKASTFVVFAALFPDSSRLEASRLVVKELSSSGFTVIVLSRIDCHFEGAFHVYLWKSVSRDYFAFKSVWRAFLSKVRSIEPIFFMNDSIIWNPGALASQLRSFESSECVVLPTESFQVMRHAQPYFFYVPNIATNQQIDTLLEPAREWRWKRTAVRRGELVFLSTLIKTELRFSFLIKHQEMHDITESRCKKLWFLGCQDNPTRLLRKYILDRYGFAKFNM